MALSESERDLSPKEKDQIIMRVPAELSPTRPIETPIGTWRLKNFGGNIGNIAIFDAHVISQKHDPIPHVDDINAYTSHLLEEVEAKVEAAAVPQIPTVTRPLARLRKAVALSAALLGKI